MRKEILSALIHDRAVFDTLEPIMDIEDDFSEQGQVIATKIHEYYSNDENAENVDRDFLIDQIKQDMPKHYELFEGIICTLNEVSIPNAMAEFRKLKLDSSGQHLAEAILSKDRTRIDAYLEKYSFYRDMEEADAEAEVFVGADLDEVLQAFERDNLIEVYPSSLNEELGGGLVRGTQVAIYAPTETGKSMLSINIACGILHQGYKVLYCGNEDPAYSMLARFYARLSGMTRDEMALDRATARKRAYQNGYQNLIFYDMAPGSIFDINRMIERYEPDVIVVDQMANMETKGSYSKVEKNEHLALRLRSLAKKHDIVSIIVHQASDSAYGKIHVEKNDMYYSNVGVQGQMDVMIGIGMDDMYEQQNKRMLCLTKNKISSKHSHIPVVVEPLLSKVSNIGEE